MSEFFVRRPDCRDRHRDSDDAHRRRVHSGAADRAISANRSAGDSSANALHRGGRAHDRASGRGADRAADERRGQHELHASINSNSGDIRLIVNFDVATDPNIDHVLTQIRVSQAQSQLPADVINYGLTVKKSTTAPLMLIAIYSPKGSYDGTFLANYGYINLFDPLTRVPGIGNVQIFGAGQYAMRLWVKPDQLAKLGITVPDIITAVQKQNTVNPAGQVGGEPIPSGQKFTYTVRAQGRLQTPEEFGEIVVRANADGSFVRVKDIARIDLGAQTYNLRGRLNGQPSAILAVYQLPGTNAVKAAQGVRKLMAEAKQRFPADMDFVVSLDQTLSVTEGLNDIVKTLFEALAAGRHRRIRFLQGWRATLIPLCAVPVSLLGTFVVFPLFGFSINTLSLFGLVLAIGLVVDDAIVVVEAVERHIEEGMSPRDATLQAMREVSGVVIGVALHSSAVFIPTAFLPGITGRLYQQFALTIAISVIFSAFNALSLSPALSAMLLRPRKKTRGPVGWFFDRFNRVFGIATHGYVNWSRIAIRKAVLSFALLAVLAVGAGLFGSRLPSGFLPEEDQGYVYLALQLPDAASLERTDAASRKIEEILSKIPGVQYTTSVVGFSLLSLVQNTYSAFFFVTFKPWSERTKPEEQYAAIKANINKQLAGLTEGIAFAFPPPAIPGVGTSGGFQFILEDRAGKDVAFLAQNLKTFLDAARKRPELGTLDSDVSAERSAGFRQRRSRQSHQAGDRSRPGLSDPPDVHGRFFCELLQSVRANMAGIYRGRRRLSHRREKRWPILRAQRQRRPSPARCHFNYPEHRRSGIHVALQRIPLGPNQRFCRAWL